MEVLSGRQLARVSDLDVSRCRGDRPALLSGDTVVSFAELASRIERRIVELGPVRRVVSLRATNTIDTVVTYLACLSGGHVVSIRSVGDAGQDPFTAAAADQLHPDLAVLMSTSGSTGAPKSVRLSVANVESNAIAIADSFELRSDDVAITSLPLHYCYGLSIVTSHLAAGAAVVITDTSVVDPCFWQLVDRHRVTTLSGVPHTFELIERLPGGPLGSDTTGRTLRRVTQAGGRLAAADVERLAELGQRHGWDFFAMYGQSEATARMTVLEPDLATDYPQSIGRPILGGSIHLAPVPLNEVPADLHADVRSGVAGEIVYRGPNVMLGYATTIDDLSLGRTNDELYTGDIARRLDNGLLEIVGRRSGFVKILGHRIDLCQLEARLAGMDVVVAGDDTRIVVAVSDTPAAEVREELSSLPIPPSAVQIHEVGVLPRLPTGKPDGATVLGWPSTADGADCRATEAAATDSRSSAPVSQIYRSVLGVDAVGPRDSFSSLGGDSLSYVEASIRIERVLGGLPVGWHLQPVCELEAQAISAPAAAGLGRLTRQIDTSVVVRAVGICIIVATHMRIARLTGGAHTLLAVAGYNFARFQLASVDLPGHVRRGLATVARVAVPASLWIGVQMALVGGYSAGSLFLVNNYFGSPWRRDGRWEYWYFEAFIQIFLALTLLFAFRPVRRLERRWPFGFVAVALVPATVVGLEVVEFADGYNSIFRPHTTVWFVLLGWAAYRASTRLQRVLVTVTLIGGAFVVFDRWQQAVMVTVFVGALVWAPTVRLPRLMVPVVGTIAAASMVTFLIHWQVWPIYTSVFLREVAFVLTIATGVATWAACRGLARRLRMTPPPPASSHPHPA